MNAIRRMFLRRVVGAAAFAPMAGNAVAESMRHQAMSTMASLPLNMPNPPMGQAGVLGQAIRTPLRLTRLREALQIAEGAARDSVMFRVGPFDPDIASIGSVSHHFRAGMQRKRDDDRRSTLERLRRLAWGN